MGMDLDKGQMEDNGISIPVTTLRAHHHPDRDGKFSNINKRGIRFLLMSFSIIQ
jgi:hypothetical protein